MIDTNIQSGFEKIIADKGKIAEAITNKGVLTNSTDSLEIMATNISNINVGSGTDAEDIYLEGFSQTSTEPINISINKATFLMPYFYYAPSTVYPSALTNKIEKLFLNKVTLLKNYDFYTNRAEKITIDKIECPVLSTINNFCFYGINFTNLDNKSFPNLTEIYQNSFSNCNFNNNETEKIFANLTTFNGTVFANSTINTGIFNFPKVTTIENGGKMFLNIKEFIFPSLKISKSIPAGGTWNFPKLKSTISANISSIETICLNQLNGTDYLFFNNQNMLNLKKLIIPKIAEAYNYQSSNKTYITLLASNTSLSGTMPNLEYLHVRDHAPCTDISINTVSEMFTNLTKLKYLIIGFKENGEQYGSITNYNINTQIRLPKLNNCGKVKAVILALGKAQSQDTDANAYLQADLNNEEKISNFKAGLLDTEEEKGYLYLSDIDYNTFISSDAGVGTNKEWLQSRVRKWSQYKNLLINEYGLDSIIDWYE